LSQKKKTFCDGCRKRSRSVGFVCPAGGPDHLAKGDRVDDPAGLWSDLLPCL